MYTHNEFNNPSPRTQIYYIVLLLALKLSSTKVTPNVQYSKTLEVSESRVAVMDIVVRNICSQVYC